MDTVTISVEEYESLKRSQAWLNALEEAGVDNWSGISFAHEIYQEEHGEGLYD